MSSPDLSAVRVQRRASVQCVSANPNEVRVRGRSSPRFSKSSLITHHPPLCFFPFLVAVSIAASRCRFWLPFGRTKSLRGTILPQASTTEGKAVETENSILKERGNDSPAPPQDFGYTRMRVWPSARRCRRQATACAGPPPTAPN
jgi:hypothetical protein